MVGEVVPPIPPKLFGRPGGEPADVEGTKVYVLTVAEYEALRARVEAVERENGDLKAALAAFVAANEEYGEPVQLYDVTERARALLVAEPEKCPTCASTDRSVRGVEMLPNFTQDFVECRDAWHRVGSPGPEGDA